MPRSACGAGDRGGAGLEVALLFAQRGIIGCVGPFRIDCTKVGEVNGIGRRVFAMGSLIDLRRAFGQFSGLGEVFFAPVETTEI